MRNSEDKITIKSISIKNFRSIKYIKINVKNNNIFVGLNDVGKSNLLKALNLFFNGETDYQNKFSFEDDFTYLFPKKSHHTKEIKISILFNIPSSYKDSGTYTWEKVWRANNYYKESIYNSKKEEPAARSRIPNSLRGIKYRYVPAVKSKLYYKSLLSDLYVAISSSINSPLQLPIDSFSKVLEEHTKKISDNVEDRLSFHSTLSMPDNLSDVFKALIFKTSTSIDDCYIPLDFRGDGLQVRHIPIILKYIADEDQNSRNRGAARVITIWGFEEPENGLELIKAFELADEFDSYSKDIQMFITSHSPAFYMKKNNENTTVFCAIRDEQTGGTVFSVEKNSKLLGEHMGLMPLIAPFVSEKMEEIKNIKKELVENSLIDVDTILVEGVTDKEYLLMAIKRYSEPLQKLIDDERLRVYSKLNKGGSTNLINLTKSWIYSGNESKLFVLFDKDKAGNEAKNKLVNSNEYKYRNKNKIAVQNLQCSDEIKKIYEHKIIIDFEIEHLFSAEMLDHLVDRKLYEERDYNELHNAFVQMMDTSSTLDGVISNICTSNQLNENIIRMNPKNKSNGKNKILTQIKKRLQDNPCDDCLNGLKHTIEKIEQYFIED